MSTPLITPELVSLDANLGSTKTEVITSVAGLIAAAGRADADGLAHDTLDRESKSPTGMMEIQCNFLERCGRNRQGMPVTFVGSDNIFQKFEKGRIGPVLVFAYVNAGRNWPCS